MSSQVSIQHVFISLYMILLAFFLILNSHVKLNQEKMENIQQSLESTFQGSTTIKEVEDLQKIIPDISENDTYNNLSNIIPILHDMSYDFIYHTNFIEAKMLIDTVFHPQTHDILPKTRELLHMLSKKILENTHNITLDIIINTNDLLNNEQSINYNIKIASLFVENGLHPDLITTSILQSDTKIISFLISYK